MSKPPRTLHADDLAELHGHGLGLVRLLEDARPQDAAWIQRFGVACSYVFADLVDLVELSDAIVEVFQQREEQS